MGVELKSHQTTAVEKTKNGSVLRGGVGVGKTHTALAYYVLKVCGGDLERLLEMRTPMNLVVLTSARKRDELDWQSTALDFGIFNEPELSYGGVGITVDSWNNIKKYENLTNTFFIFDEQKAGGAGAWSKTFLKIVKKEGNQWILLSATPADTWIEYVPLFIAHGFYKNRTDFVEQHVVWSFHGKYRKIRGYYGVRHLERFRDSIVVDMPYERHTVRHLIPVEVEYDSLAFDRVWKGRWNVYLDEPLVDVAEMHRVGRKVVNSDPSRLKKIEHLSNTKHDRMIIFYTHDYELEMLRTLHTTLDIPVSEWNGHRHDAVPSGERWLYLVQYSAGAEAWNCTTTDAIVFYSLTYSHKLFAQSQGRIDRMNTPYTDLWYYILMSKAKIDVLIWRALNTKKNFHEGHNTKFNTAA